MPQLVSCIIPTYNRPKFLKRAVVSVLNQTYTNLEIIVVDDNSSGDTREVLSPLEDKNIPISYYRNSTNIGGAATRNRGIELARGEYVAFLDDDDEWLPKKISKQMKFITDYPFIGTLYKRINNKKKNNAFGLKSLVNFFNHHGKRTTISLEDTLYSNCGISPSSSLFERKKLVKIGGFDEDLAGNQGRDLFIRFLHRYQKSCLRINERLVVQYQNHKQRISTTGGERIISIRNVHDRHEHLMPKWLKRLDRNRILFEEAKYEESLIEKIKLHVKGVSQFDITKPLPFLKLYFKTYLL